jgi:hypothetical protein
VASMFWPKGSVSVILLPSGTQGDEVLAAARDWTRAGLLSPALWVRPETVVVEQGAPPQIPAILIAHSVAGEVVEVTRDLFETLAQESLGLLRLVKLRSVRPDRQLDGLQDTISKAVQSYVGHAMPLVSPKSNNARARADLSRITLICAPTEFVLAERVAWGDEDSSTVLVAAPEDRTNPWAGDAFVRDDQRFVGFVLMHLATASGLWTSAPVGTLELFDHEASASESIWIPRVFISGVLTDGLARRIAAQVLTDAADAASTLIDPRTGVPAAGTVPIRDELVQDYVELMLKASLALDEARLQYKPFRPVADADQLRIGSSRQIRHYLSFLSGKILRIPHWYATAARSRFSGFLNRNLQGEHGRYVVGELERLDGRDQSLVRARDRAAAELAEAQTRERQVLDATLVHTSPRVWEGIRTLIFGSIDASSDLSGYGFALIEDKVPVFGRVADIVADPNGSWQPTSELGQEIFPDPVDWATARKMPELRDNFVSIIGEARSMIDPTSGEIADTQKRVLAIGTEESELRKRLLALGVLKYNKAGEVYAPKKGAAAAAAAESASIRDSDTGTSVDEAPAAADLLERYRQIPNEATGYDRQLRELRERSSFQLQRRDDVTADLASFDAWMNAHSYSFDNQLLDRLLTSCEVAAADSAEFEQQLRAIEVPDAVELVTLRKRFHRDVALWTLIPLAMAAVVYWGIWYWNRDDVDFDPWALVMIVATIWLLIVVAATLGAGARYYQKWSAYERSVDLIASRIDQAEDGWAGSRRELTRLISLREQAADWLEIIATALHHPWMVRPEWREQATRTMDTANLPFAMHIANATTHDDGAANRLERNAAPTLLRKGWREEAFRDLLEEIAKVVGVPPAAIGTDALDSDMPHASNNSRSIVRSHMNEPALLEKVATRRITNLIAVIQRDSLVGGGVDVLPLTPGHFAGLTNEVQGLPAGNIGVPWDAHLRQTLGTATDFVPPINPLVISSVSIQAGHHQDLTSYVLAPERLVAGIEATTGEGVEVVAYDSTVSPSLDLVVRVDMAGPIPVGALNLWRGSSVHSAPQLVEGELAACLTCGRTDCPGAFDRVCGSARSGV